MTRCIALATLLAACTHPHADAGVAAAASDGVSIAIYRGADQNLGVVDDRRAVTIAHGELVLEQIPDGASLASLTIEPLGGGPLAIHSCTRDSVEVAFDGGLLEHVSDTYVEPPANEPYAQRAEGQYRMQKVSVDEDRPEANVGIAYSTAGQPGFGKPTGPEGPTLRSFTKSVPTIRCHVDARDGTRRVRVLYVVSDLAFDARTYITMTAPDHAQVSAVYTFTTPARGVAGDVTLFTGLPGSNTPPVQVAAGTAELDGGVTLFTTPPTDVKAHLRPLFVAMTDTESDDAQYGNDEYLGRGEGYYGSTAHPRAQPVQVWLDLQTTIESDAAFAHIELPGEVPRDVDLAKDSVFVDKVRGITRAPLWNDDHLLITVERSVLSDDDRVRRVRTRLTVANTDTVAHDVDFEQTLPSSSTRTLEATWPTPPTLVPTGVRAKLTAPPGGLVRMRFIVSTKDAVAAKPPEPTPERYAPFE